MHTTLTHSAAPTASSNWTHTLAGRVTLALLATVVVALAAHVAIPLPFTPVPLTLQPLAVLAVGLALGPVEAAAAMLAYLAEGACGLPVFSPTGVGGVAQLLGPTGGFLMSYPAVALVASLGVRALRRRTPAFLAAAVAGVAAVCLLFVCGAAWLQFETHATLPVVLAHAVLPFLPGEAIKILVAAGIYSAAVQSRSARA